jgi:hypothetical protein
MKGLIISVSLGALVIGVVEPRTAIRSAHALVVLLMISAIVVLIQPSLTAWEISRARPFTSSQRIPARWIAPAVIRETVDEVGKPKRFLSPRIRSRIGVIAVGRLLDHHRFTEETIGADDVRAVVSPTLADIVLGENEDVEIPLGELDSLLDELEHL